MKALKHPAIAAVFVVLTASLSADVVVPNSQAGVEGSSAFNLYSTTTGRTYQMTIDSSELATVIGQNITGLQLRLNGTASANWPIADFTFSLFDVYAGPGVDPSAMSNTFASNYTGARTQVRSGSQTFLAGSFTSGSSPNAFGPAISFDSPYLYLGGDLTLELRYSANTSGASFSADALSVSGGPGNGWGVLFAARWTGDSAGTVGTNGNFIVTNLVTQAVPEPSSFGVLALAVSGLLVRRKR